MNAIETIHKMETHLYGLIDNLGIQQGLHRDIHGSSSALSAETE